MDHLQNVIRITDDAATVRRLGGKLGKDFDRQEAAWTALAAPDMSASERLADAIASGADEAELGRLWTATIVALLATPQVIAAARIDVAHHLTPTLHAALTEHASDNYLMARTRYNGAGAALVKAIDIVDPNAAPESLVEEPDRLRTWGTVPRLVADVEAALVDLTDAARVAGLPDTAENVAGLALTVPPGAKRRQVWEAFEGRDVAGRAKRWGPLLATGCKPLAPTLDEHAAYRRPAPMQVQYWSVQFGHAAVEVDPEDAVEAEAAAARAGRKSVTVRQ